MRQKLSILNFKLSCSLSNKKITGLLLLLLLLYFHDMILSRPTQ